PLPNASATCTCTAGAIAAPATASAGWVTIASDAAAAGDTVNPALVAAGSTPLVAVSCFEPGRFTVGVAKLAMPAAVLATLPPPVSVPVPGLVSVNVTAVPDTALPNASVTFTCTAGAIDTPATTFVGCAVNASDAAAAAVTVNDVLVTGVTVAHAA